MSSVGSLRRHCVEWGVASRALEGQSESGDLHVVVRTPGGTMACVVDGLGHGASAAHAARIAVATLRACAAEHPIAVIGRCHEALRDTRGVVMSVVAFHARDRVLTWIGVGNVAGALIHADRQARPETLLLRPGIVGGNLPALAARSIPAAEGDFVILATDGIRPVFETLIGATGPSQSIADRFLGQHTRGTDDSLALVLRFRGPS